MLKKIIKTIFEKLGYVVMRTHQGFVPVWVPQHQSKIDLLELLIKQESGQGDFDFIQIGANDGIRADPISKLVRKYDLKGIMIEPIPDIFRQLKENYEDVKGNIEFLNLAITVSGDKGAMPFYCFNAPSKDLQDKLSGYSSTSKERLEAIKVEQNINASVAAINVPYESVSHLLKSRAKSKVSLLVTDVEGLDIEIVTEFVNCGVFPKIIVMEILDQLSNERAGVMKLLADSGYSFGGKHIGFDRI